MSIMSLIPMGNFLAGSRMLHGMTSRVDRFPGSSECSWLSTFTGICHDFERISRFREFTRVNCVLIFTGLDCVLKITRGQLRLDLKQGLSVSCIQQERLRLRQQLKQLRIAPRRRTYTPAWSSKERQAAQAKVQLPVLLLDFSTCFRADFLHLFSMEWGWEGVRHLHVVFVVLKRRDNHPRVLVRYRRGSWPFTCWYPGCIPRVTWWVHPLHPPCYVPRGAQGSPYIYF